MSPPSNRSSGTPRFVRVMLQVTDACERPGFVFEPEFFFPWRHFGQGAVRPA